MSQLIKYEAACRALAECKSVDEVKTWTDKAAAMQAYGRMAKDKTLEVDAAEIRIRAERRLGEMLAAQKAGSGLAKPGVKPSVNSVVTNDRIAVPKLADAGISKDLSSRAQKLAAVPEAEFEREVGEWRERVTEEGRRVSARLEAAGEREQAKQAAPAEEPPQPEDTGPDESELAANRAAEQADREALEKLLEADDKLATAVAEVKRLNHLNAQLQQRINGLMNEKAEAIKLCKSLQRKLDKLQKVEA